MTDLADEILEAKALKRTKYTRFCLKQNPFAMFDYGANADAVEKTLAGRKKERKKLLQAFAELLDGERKHIIIRGEKGIGKSHLASLFFHQILQNTEKLGINPPVMITSVDGLNSSRIQQDLKEQNKRLIYFVDDAGKMSVDHASQIFEFFSLQGIFVISCWENVHWEKFLNDPRYGLRGFEGVQVEALTDQELIDALKMRIEFYSTSPEHSLSHFSKGFFKQLAEISFGNPSRLLAAADECLHRALDKDKDDVGEAEVATVAKDFGLLTAEELDRKLHKLTAAQRYVFGALVVVTKKYNVSSANLGAVADAVGFQRPTVLAHLMNLVEKGIVLRNESPYGSAITYSPKPPFGEYVLFRHVDWIDTVMQRFSRLRGDEKKVQG